MPQNKRGGGFAPGHPRYGGRIKGTPNRLSETTQELAAAVGFHPVSFLAVVAVKGYIPNPDGTKTPVSAQERIDAAKAAAPYICPKLQATTVSGPNDGPIEVSTPLDVSLVLSNPELAKAAQEIALLMLDAEDQEQPAIQFAPEYRALPVPGPAGSSDAE